MQYAICKIFCCFCFFRNHPRLLGLFLLPKSPTPLSAPAASSAAGADLITLFSLARASGSLIVGPTFAGRRSDDVDVFLVFGRLVQSVVLFVFFSKSQWEGGLVGKRKGSGSPGLIFVWLLVFFAMWKMVWVLVVVSFLKGGMGQRRKKTVRLQGSLMGPPWVEGNNQKEMWLSSGIQ